MHDDARDRVGDGIFEVSREDREPHEPTKDPEREHASDRGEDDLFHTASIR